MPVPIYIQVSTCLIWRGVSRRSRDTAATLYLFFSTVWSPLLPSLSATRFEADCNNSLIVIHPCRLQRVAGQIGSQTSVVGSDLWFSKSTAEDSGDCEHRFLRTTVLEMSRIRHKRVHERDDDRSHSRDSERYLLHSFPRAGSFPVTSSVTLYVDESLAGYSLAEERGVASVGS
jgi:hypothetical protein